MTLLPHLLKLESLSLELLNLARLSGQVLPLDDSDDEQEQVLQEMAMDQLWSKRSRMVRDITRQMGKGSGYWSNWQESLSQLQEDEQQQAVSLVDTIKELLQQVQQLDTDTKGIVEALREQARVELESLSRKRKVVRAYQPASLVNPQNALPVNLSRTT